MYKNFTQLGHRTGRILMNDDEINTIDEYLRDQCNMLDRLLLQIINTLERGRDDIYSIAQESDEKVQRLESELHNVILESNRVVAQRQEQEEKERLAQLHLMNISPNSGAHSEKDLSKANETIQEIQLRLMDLRQAEIQLHQLGVQLSQQLEEIRAIKQKADTFMNSTGMALKSLHSNLETISYTQGEQINTKQLALWILQSQETERRKIARELHDGPAQMMASILMRLDFIKQNFIDISDTNGQLDDIQKMSRDSLDEIRRIMFDLKPAPIHEAEFYYTMRDYFREFQAKYNFEIDFSMLGEKKKYDLALESALFRLLQEAITNIRKHAGIKKALITMDDNGKTLTVVIKDEGRGFNTELLPGRDSYGIPGMKERVQLLDGDMVINSHPGQGTQIIIRVPLKGEAENG